MNRIIILLFIGPLYSVNPSFANAQDTLNRLSVEFDFRLVPIVRSFYGTDDFRKIKTEPTDTGFLTTNSPHNFRISYSARLNISSKKGLVMFGLAAKYSRSTNYGRRIYHPDSAFSMLMTENLVADYIGANVRIMVDPLNNNYLKHGFTLGGGVLLGRSNIVPLAIDDDEIQLDGGSKKRQYVFDEILPFDLGYKARLYDLYLNYTFQFLFKVGDRVSLFAGFEIPLLRLFFFNSQTRFGVTFNDEDFFTSHESFVPHIGEQMTLNKNFAFSMKKTNSFSLNFGLRYFFN